MSDSTTQVVLHIWPRQSPALSFDPQCVSALFYLQYSIPGRFSLAYCANPDLSPSGQLPFLTHGFHSAATLPSIIKYVAHMPGARDVDGALSAVEKAQTAARVAHVQSDYGDLVTHMSYCLHDNWWKTTRPALVSVLPVPQRYYVPNRLRESHRERLEIAELWNVPGVEQEEQEERAAFGKRKKKKSSGPDKFKKVFERERVLEKARAFFDIYAKVLGDRPLFHLHNGLPTSLDLIFAAHTHVLMNIPFADTLITSLLSDSYPALVTHAITVQAAVFPDSLPSPPVIETGMITGWQSVLSWPRFASTGERKDSSRPDEREERYSVMRWGFAGLAAVALVVYTQLFGVGIEVAIVSGKDVEEEVELEEEDSDEVMAREVDEVEAYES
ncbi:hypothetical protein B0H21DRAFT_715514 [Amylocystis lapponica]|nr:hypothetical protein B0H21DRAFT_715514 [Amylocystis lapponica]